MANVAFYRGTTTPSTSNLPDGGIYFNTSNKITYMRSGTAIYQFKGTDTINVPGYSSTGAGTSRSYGFCNIQNVPHYFSNTTYTSGLSNSWWYLWGQNAASCELVWEQSSYNGFDYAMAYYKSLPPLDNAKEIILAVDVYNLGRAINSGTTPTSLTVAFPTSSPLIMSVYRTNCSSTPAQAYDDYSYYSGTDMGPMFTGTTSLSGYYSASSSSYGRCTSIGYLSIRLCMNATNAVEAVIHSVELEGASEKFSGSSISGASARYQYDGGSAESYLPNIEKHIYPIAIRYI